jgi:hypothetical protein
VNCETVKNCEEKLFKNILNKGTKPRVVKSLKRVEGQIFRKYFFMLKKGFFQGFLKSF